MEIEAWTKDGKGQKFLFSSEFGQCPVLLRSLWIHIIWRKRYISFIQSTKHLFWSEERRSLLLKQNKYSRSYIQPVFKVSLCMVVTRPLWPVLVLVLLETRGYEQDILPLWPPVHWIWGLSSMIQYQFVRAAVIKSQTEWLKQQRWIVSQFSRLDVQTQSVGRVGSFRRLWERICSSPLS